MRKFRPSTCELSQFVETVQIDWLLRLPKVEEVKLGNILLKISVVFTMWTSSHRT